MRPETAVAVGIIYQKDGKVLLSSRPKGKPYEGYWEFAGGKIEPDETPFLALQREFLEELGIRIHAATPWLVKTFDYEHARVRLHFFKVAPNEWSGEIVFKENQEVAWQMPNQYSVAPMLPANSSLLNALAIPPQLSGTFATGLFAAAPNPFRALPYAQSSLQSADAILLSISELSSLATLPPQTAAKWVGLSSINEWQQLDFENIDAIVWRIENEAQAQNFTQILSQGAPCPIIAHASPSLYATHLANWLKLGLSATVKN